MASPGVATPPVFPVFRPFAISHLPVPASAPLADRLEANSAYFDAVLSLVHAKHYLAAQDEDEAGDSTFHKHKAGAASTKDTKKANAKRVRFDVESQRTVPQLQKAAAAAAGSKRPRSSRLGVDGDGDDDGDSSNGVEEGDAADGNGDDDAWLRPGIGATPLLPPRPAASIGELRARLRAKIEAMRVARKAPASPGAAGAGADGARAASALDDDDENSDVEMSGRGGGARPGPAGELRADAQAGRAERKAAKQAAKKARAKAQASCPAVHRKRGRS